MVREREIASKAPDDQFTFFWLVIELIAQVIKEPAPVPDRCPKCKTPLYCSDCQATPLHRPYARQAIEQLFGKYCSDEPEEFYRRANEARNMLIHGEDVEAIEAALAMPFSDKVVADRLAIRLGERVVSDRQGRRLWPTLRTLLARQLPFVREVHQNGH